MHYPRKSIWLLVFLVVIIGAGLALLTYGNFRYAAKNPGGNDFLVHWMGSRVFLTEGISPYSDEAALRIQTVAYGRPARAGEHELRVAYPFYSILLFAPFALIPDFILARALWMTTLEAALVGLAFVSIRLSGWKPGLWLTVIFLVFSLLWYHSLRPLINGNAVILIAFALAAAFLSIRNGIDELAGVLFAFTTIKPQVVFVILIFVIFWSILKHRWRLLAWMAGTLVLLVVIATILMPDWMLQNLREILRYPAYNPPGTPAAAFSQWLPGGVGMRLGLVLTAIMALLMLLEWVRSSRVEFRDYFWIVCLTLTAAQWVGIQTDPGNYIILFPAMPLVFAVLGERWPRAGKWISSTMMLALFVGLWVLFISTVEYGYQPQQSPIMIFPLPFFLLVMLYWIRWWVGKPPYLWVDELKELEKTSRT